MPNIPSVDLNDFLSNDQNLKSEFVGKLGKAYKEIGFEITCSYTKAEENQLLKMV